MKIFIVIFTLVALAVAEGVLFVRTSHYIDAHREDQAAALAYLKRRGILMLSLPLAYLAVALVCKFVFHLL